MLIAIAVSRTLLDAHCVDGAVTPEFLRHHFSQVSVGGHPCLATEWATRQTKEGSDASFLLEYCMRDMPPVPFSALSGLELVPMETEGVLGRLDGPTDIPLYLASDFERKLLQRVGQVRARGASRQASLALTYVSPLLC